MESLFDLIKDDNSKFVKTNTPSGNSDTSILYIVNDFSDGNLIVPSFQRKDNIWDKQKMKGWIESIVLQNAIGVIVTYQIVGNSTTFLADGLQRVKTTKLFLDNPEQFGIIKCVGRTITKEEAIQYCKNFKMTIQHRNYDNHQQAMTAFQNLNKGSYMTPEELYKGIITTSNYGFLKDEVINIVNSVEKQWRYSLRSSDRRNQSRENRDCYGLFFQYLSKYTGKSFWRVGSTNEEEQSSPIEQILINYFFENNFGEIGVRNELKKFEQYLWEIKAFLDTIMEENGQGEFSMSPAFCRHILHLVIHFKNNRFPVSVYRNYIKGFFGIYNDIGEKSFSSQIPIPINGKIVTMTLKMDAINSTSKVQKYLGIDLYDEENKRLSQKRRVGFNDSHIKPFSIFGNGETISENALDNIARGAKEIV